MKFFSTLHSRLLLTFFGLLLLGFSGLTWLAGNQIAENIYNGGLKELENHSLRLAASLHEVIENHGFDADKIECALLEELTRSSDKRVEFEDCLLQDKRLRLPFDVMVLEPSTELIFESRKSLSNEERDHRQKIMNCLILDSKKDNLVSDRESDDRESDDQDNEERDHRQRIMDCLISDSKEGIPPDSKKGILGSYRESGDQGAAIFYAVAEIYDDYTIGYVYLVQPADESQEEVWESWQFLGSSLLGFSAVSLLCALWLLSTILRPLSKLRDTTLRMAKGDLSQRVMNPGHDEVGQVGQAFNHMANQVAQMVDEQRAFASNAAHELRTPLTTIRLRAEGLQSDDLDEETSQQYIAEIDSETNHMSGLVDDLFLLSQLDSERLAIGQEMIDASRLARRIYNELSPRAEQRSITVTLNEPSELLPPAQTTLSHLHMVIRNLLENAIKYTPENGHVTVSLAEHLAKGRNFLRIEVSDTGQGIAEEDLHRITQRFYRDARARARQKTQGSGLGLALVDSIIALYGGQLQITSAGPNLGTRAIVLWPFEQE